MASLGTITAFVMGILPRATIGPRGTAIQWEVRGNRADTHVFKVIIEFLAATQVIMPLTFIPAYISMQTSVLVQAANEDVRSCAFALLISVHIYTHIYIYPGPMWPGLSWCEVLHSYREQTDEQKS